MGNDNVWDNEFLEFEDSVMKALLREDEKISKKLIKQYESIVVTDRYFSGDGFITEFEVRNFDNRLNASDLLHRFEISNERIVLRNVHAEVNALEYGARFLLFIDDGLINFLEGFTAGSEKWPNKISNYTVSILQE